MESTLVYYLSLATFHESNKVVNAAVVRQKYLDVESPFARLPRLRESLVITTVTTNNNHRPCGKIIVGLVQRYRHQMPRQTENQIELRTEKPFRESIDIGKNSIASEAITLVYAISMVHDHRTDFLTRNAAKPRVRRQMQYRCSFTCHHVSKSKPGCMSSSYRWYTTWLCCNIAFDYHRIYVLG